MKILNLEFGLLPIYYKKRGTTMNNRIIDHNYEIYRDPTKEELDSELFESIWQTIKKWDISTEWDVDKYGNRLYSTATGNHVVAIMDAIKEAGIKEV